MSNFKYPELLPRISGIYTITNLVNNKMYLGYTKSFIDRRDSHFSELRLNIHKNTYLQRAWNKYGESNFKFEILVECPEELLPSEEHYWATLLNVNNPKFGYNNRLTHPYNRTVHTPETIEKMRRKLIGRSPNLSEQGKLNKINAQKNRIRSEEEKRKGGLTKRKPLICLNLKGEFLKEYTHAREAAKHTGADYKLISMNCKGKRSNTNGYIFVFKKDYDKNKDYSKNILTGNKIPIIMYNETSVVEFESITKALKFIGTQGFQQINRAIVKGVKYRNYNWKYKE